MYSMKATCEHIIILGPRGTAKVLLPYLDIYNYSYSAMTRFTFAVVLSLVFFCFGILSEEEQEV